jgi:DNA-binding CsgD family transcriptional regulator
MISLNQSLTELVSDGKITREIALKYSLNPQALESRLKKV